jgi:putative hydrolase of the HAD superfamily
VSYRAVFFDAGETLVHPHPSFLELLQSILEREGHPVELDTLIGGLSVVSDRFAMMAKTGQIWSNSAEKSRGFWLGVYGDLLERVGVRDTDGLADVLYGAFTNLDNYRLFPDVERTLEKLRTAGLRLGLVSNFEQWLDLLLERLGVTAYFETRVISGVEGIEKPDERIFRLALDRTGMQAGDSVYVGDSPVFDTQPAEAIGMLGVLLDRRGRYPEHAGIRITTLDELPAAIGLQG